MMVLSGDFGVTFDEWAQFEYGRRVVAYLISGGSDHSSESYRNLFMYGGFFDALSFGAVNVLGEMLAHDVRHLLNGIFAWICIAFTAQISRVALGPVAGIGTALALAVSPVFFGMSMNNPKDIPFAAFAAMALCFSQNYHVRFPYYSWQSFFKISAAIGLALSVRVGGVILLFEFGLLLIFLFLRDRNNAKTPTRKALTMFAIVSGCSVLAFSVALMFWPWALQDPVPRIKQALTVFSNFNVTIMVQFAGKWLPSDGLPWFYVPWHFLIQTPPILIIGFLAACAGLAFSMRRVGASGQFLQRLGGDSPRIFFAAYTCLGFMGLPMIYTMVFKPPLYDSIRHFIFIYPAMVVIASSALYLVIKSFAGYGRQRVVFSLAILSGFIPPLAFQIRNHPNQYVYYNGLVGGTSGAFGQYEMDYWGGCIREGLARVNKISIDSSGADLGTGGSEPVKIPVYLDHVDFWNFYVQEFKYLSLVRSPAEAAYEVVLLRYDPHTIAEFLREPYESAVTVDGVPMCLVRKLKRAP